MKKNLLPLQSFRLKNFKAVRDSGIVKFTPLTVFIGNNGVGKSSLIEGLETLKSVATDGLDEAMQQWRGFEYICNRAVAHPPRKTPEGREYQTNPMTFEIAGTAREGRGDKAGYYTFRASSEITAGPEGNEIFFLREQLHQDRSGSKRHVTRSTTGEVWDQTEGYPPIREPLSPNRSVLYAEPSTRLWHWVLLNPEVMGAPKLLGRTGGYRSLARDGSNIAEYYLNISQLDATSGTSIRGGIVETLQYVLPYLRDLQPVLTSELGHSVHLQMTEENFVLPGWLLSTGTLRLVALLALFRHPTPPSLIIIEEIENGLDPRTIHLLVEEIRTAIENGIQVILTTHSPYLLDLLPLESLIFVERVDGQPRFFRPQDDESVQRWSKDFAPGSLYTMGRFRQGQLK